MAQRISPDALDTYTDCGAVSAMSITRRDFLRQCSIYAGGAWLLGACDDSGGPIDAPGDDFCADAFARGTFVTRVPFADEDVVAFAERLGQGLDGRLYTDLSSVPEASLTSSDKFYLRTFKPDLLPPIADWRVAVSGHVQSPVSLTVDELVGDAFEDMGAHVLECSGNFREAGFGLMSAATWAGVRVSRVLERLAPTAAARRLLVGGFDQHSVPSVNGHSTPGASWIFSLDQIAATGAFFATTMNGAPLPLDNGAPLRLYVPGWYGCACIKWVDSIELVDDDAPATSQMIEFAARTHQIGTPTLARDYLPAQMDQAAMPVRIERWLVDGRPLYRIFGILWGGGRPTSALELNDGSQAPIPIEVCPPAAQNALWTVWQTAWRPTRTGLHMLSLTVPDRTITTRRLDTGFYRRFVDIDVLT